MRKYCKSNGSLFTVLVIYSSMKILVTCPFGLASLMSSELKRLWFQIDKTFDTWVYLETDLSWIYQINIWSRIANKVYLLLAEWESQTFDQIFDITAKFPNRSEYISHIDEISISVSTKKSLLNSAKTIQSISHKAIINSIQSQEKNQNPSPAEQETPLIRGAKIEKKEILIHIENDQAQIFVNTSWKALYQRWYRTATGDAPIKENIAAAMILLTWWKFKENFIDPFCGSWTLPIEAAMIAKNMAPGTNRNFSFQYFQNYNSELFDSLVQEAKSKIFDAKYSIFWYDKDEEMIKISNENARNAGVEDVVVFAQSDYLDLQIPEKSRIISNPPYGNRLRPENMTSLYQKLSIDFQAASGWIITTFLEFKTFIDEKMRSRKMLYNGPSECDFRYKKVVR